MIGHCLAALESDPYNLSLRVGILKVTEALPPAGWVNTQDTSGPFFRKPLQHLRPFLLAANSQQQ